MTSKYTYFLRKFDVNQFAYLRNRSTTQALLVVVEEIKRSLLRGEVAGAVFFDFTDAFGSVNRDHLLLKIGRDFGISGQLFLHIACFLEGRFARIKFSDKIGEWLESIFGTSAGTSLGPLLFIMHLHDIPPCVMPKCADDLVALATGKDVDCVTKSLQSAVDQLLLWSQKEGMQINTDKTKVMLFGDMVFDLKVTVSGTRLENVRSFKYLGILLDPLLNFTVQTYHAVAKAKRASAKVCSLINGRKEISVSLAVQLYKSLVRPHMEYAIPVWASLSDNDVKKLEDTQLQCLRRCVGSKAHSSSAALEVICNVLPFRYRKRELCRREFITLKVKDEEDILHKLLESSVRVALRFCPLMYIRIMSKPVSYTHLTLPTILRV